MNQASGRIEMYQADTQRQLQHAIESLAIDVPPRDQGRTTEDCEQWQIERLLQALLQAGELPLPVSLTKRERPDFLLTAGTHSVGIEPTEAINRDYVAATMHPNARQSGSLVDPSLYRWGTAGRTREQIAEEAGRTELTGDGWAGDSVEREFGAMVADIVRSKSAKLRDALRPVRLRQLADLPEPDSAVPRHPRRAGVNAENAVAPLLGSSGFRNVYVDDGERILELTATGSRIL